MLSWLKSKVGVGAIVLLTAVPALAQTSNFGTLNLSPGFKRSEGRANGITRGNFSLTTVAQRDSLGNFCRGFSSDLQLPDHELKLEAPFPSLTLRIEPQDKKDTALLVRGPNGLILCGDSGDSAKPFNLKASDLATGTYQVWVGTVNAGERADYTLSVRE